MVETTEHIYIVEDHASVLDSLVAIFNHGGMHTHAFASAEAFLTDGPPRRPGCLIIDLKLPSISGEQLYAHLSDHINPLPVIVVTGYATVPLSVRLMEKGIMTLLEKPFDPAKLCQYVEKAVEFDRCQIEVHNRYRDLQGCWSGMSDRQRQVLDRIVNGLPSKAIARELDVSQRTIEIERSRLLATFDVETTPELVAKTTEFRVLTQFGRQGHSILRKHAASFAASYDDTPH